MAAVYRRRVLCLIGLPRGRLNPAGPEAFLLLGYMILLSAVAFVIWTALLYYNPVGKITVYNFMTPVFRRDSICRLPGEKTCGIGGIWSLWRWCVLEFLQ